ncbi:Nn.00g106410.m01.CDS01 [Neocucurbitaria sp. VM-36]
MAAATADQQLSRPQPRHLYSYVAQPQLYSDHYGDHQNTPEGPISIAFTKSSRRSIHTNNDLVKGVVHCKARLQIQRVAIKFIGRTTNRIFNERNPTSQHVAETDLFCHEKTLSKRETPSATCPPGRVEYPFEFRFPEAVEQDPKIQNGSPFKPDDFFEYERGHMLPPSLWWNESTVRSEYFLEAEFYTEQTSFTLNPVVIHQLRFSPSVPEQGLPISVPLLPAPPIRFERKSRPPTPEPSHERRGPLKRIKSGLRGGDKIEEADSTSLIVLSAPLHYRVRSPSTLKLSLQATLSDGNSRPAPVFLRGIRAQAIAHINYRVPVSSASNGEIRKECIEKFDLFNQRYSKPGLEITDNTTLDGFEINSIVPPTFKTYGVAIHYDVRYDLLLNCAGKESEHEVETKDVAIEPMTRPGGHLGPPEDPPPPRESDESLVTDEMMQSRGVVGLAVGSPPAYFL